MEMTSPQLKHKPVKGLETVDWNNSMQSRAWLFFSYIAKLWSAKALIRRLFDIKKRIKNSLS